MKLKYENLDNVGMMDKTHCEVNTMMLREVLISAQRNNIELLTGVEQCASYYTNKLFIY